MVDQVRIDQVLEISPTVIGEEHVDGLGGLAPAAFRGDRVVDAVYDPVAVGKELVRLDLLHGLGDGLGAKRTADLLEGE